MLSYCFAVLFLTAGIARPVETAAQLRLYGVEIGGMEDGFSLTDRSAFESAKRTGARFIDLRPLWSILEPRPGEFDWRTLDAALANAASVDLPVTITMRFFDDQIPAWLADENMLDQTGKPYFGYSGEKSRSVSYWGPRARESYLRLVEAMVGRYRGNAAVLAWQFFYGYNDSFYMGMWQGRETVYDYSKFSQEKYRYYLSSVLGLSLGELNRRYGSNSRRWEEIEQPKPAFGALNVARSWHDFQEYRLWSIERMFDEIDRTVRQLDRRPLIMYYGGSLHHSAHQLSVYDVGLRLLKKYGGALDVTCFEDPVPAEIGSGIVRAYGVPLMAEAWQVPPPLPDFRRLFFHAFSLGVKSYQMVGNWQKMATSPAEFQRTGEVFREAAEAQPIRAPVAGLISYTTILSHIPARGYINPTLAMVPKLQESQYSLDWHSDRTPLDQLGDYPALLDANSEVLPQAVIERLGRYVEEGGRLALLWRSGRYALEQGSPTYPLLARLKCPRPQSLDLETWRAGKGEVIRVGRDTDWQSPEGVRLLARLMEWLKVERPVTAAPGVLASVSRGQRGELYVALFWPKAETRTATFALRAGLLPAASRFRVLNLFDSDRRAQVVERQALETGLSVSFAANELKVLKVTAEEAQTVDAARGLILSNDHVRFEFEPNGMGLSAMVDRRSGVNHIQPTQEKHLLWEVAFGKGALIRRITNNYKPCNHARIEKLPDGGQRAVMEWNDLRWWLEDRVVTIHVTVELPASSGVAQWRIFVENRSDYWGLWSVTFPMVSGLPESGKYDIARPTFGSGGHLLKAAARKIEGRYPSGNWPMQFLSLSRGKDSVYFASMDPDARAKDFVVEPGDKLSLVHYAENMGVASSDYPDYYPVALGVYQGAWLEAAQRYRPWALRQKWAQGGKLSQRTPMPDIIKDVGLWVRDDWTWAGKQGAPSEMNAPFLDARTRMDVPMAIHWYNWHHMPFDNLYPHFLPAKPGFKERVKELVDRGLLVMPYINGSSADMNIPDFDKFAPHAILDEAGGYRMHHYSDRAGRLLSMCPSREFWQDAISSLVESLLGAQGVNGVYVDQISAMSHELCFSKTHGHPLGGGRYWADGNRDLLRKVQAVAHRDGRRSVITSEGADEVFFDLLDANLTWAQPTDWEIPLMEVVYSGYTLFFGSPCDYTQSDRFFRFAQGQALIDGRQNGWIDFGLFRPEHAKKADYFRQCGKYRVAARKFLTYGQLLRPLDPVKPVPTFTEDAFGWQTKHRGVVPSAEARLWKAEDGHLGIFMANYVDEAVRFSWEVDPAKHGLTSGHFQLTEITPQGASPIGSASGAIRRTEELGPAKIKVIEIAASR